MFSFVQLPLRISQHRLIYIFLKTDIKNDVTLQISVLALLILMIHGVNTVSEINSSKDEG